MARLAIAARHDAVELVALHEDHLARQPAVLIDPATHRSRVNAPQRLRPERTRDGPSVPIRHPRGVESEARPVRGADALARNEAQHQGAGRQAIAIDDDALT